MAETLLVFCLCAMPVPGVLHLCDAVGSLGNSFEHLRRVNFLGAAMPYGPDMPEVYQLDRRIARAAIFFFIFLLYFTASFFTSVSQQCHSMALTLTKQLGANASSWYICGYDNISLC